MNNQLFLQNYQHLQYGIMYHHLVHMGFASLAWCRQYASPYFNHAQVDGLIDKTQLQAVEQKMVEMDRSPAIYFENTDENKELSAFLNDSGYSQLWEDVWMFYQKDSLDLNDKFQVKKVSNSSELKEYLESFDSCYQKDDPQNPYGELGDYLEIAEESWHLFYENGKLQYFTVYKDEEPVAVSALTNFAGIGYISNVGSLRSKRGEGFGKIASLWAVKQSKENGNAFHALATEEGTYPYEFYKRIGFDAKFTAAGYVKDDSE